MSDLFPFQLPAATAWYAVLEVATLLLHVVFMTYVLAGTIMLGVAGGRGLLGREGGTSAWQPVATLLKEWMPFALSAAITAGIGPLLFVQILYQQEFYTANLLSSHRWMAILPVLIVAFYLLYVLKAHRLEGRRIAQGTVAFVIMTCMLFVAWSWVEDHLRSLDRAGWAEQYASDDLVYTDRAIGPRLVFWIAAAFPTACAVIAWQLRHGASGIARDVGERALRPLAGLSLAMLVLAALDAWPALTGPAKENALIATKANFTVASVLLALGSVLQALHWLPVWRGGRPTTAQRYGLAAGVVLFWLGALVAREVARLSALATPELFARHDKVATTAGFGVFLVFAVITIGVVAWIVATVSRATRGERGV